MRLAPEQSDRVAAWGCPMAMIKVRQTPGHRGRIHLLYSIVFLLLAVGFLLVGVTTWETVGWVVVLPLYAALSFVLLAVAYAGAGPRLLFKRAVGGRSVAGWLLFAPY